MKKILAALALLFSSTISFAGPKEDNPEYALGTGDKAARRLDKQHEIVKAHTFELVDKVGLKEGQKILDIGCGSGSMTLYFAEKVGPTGHVYALDISDKQLEQAKAAVAAAGHKNVTFIQVNIQDQDPEELRPLAGQIDLCFTRFLLMHLPNVDGALGNMLKLLKDGGYAASHEAIMGEAEITTGNPVFGRYVNSIVELGRKLGSDRNMGRHMQSHYEKAGFVTREYYDRVREEKLKSMLEQIKLGLNEQIPAFKKFEIITEGDVSDILREFARDAEKEEAILKLKAGFIVVQKMCDGGRSM